MDVLHDKGHRLWVQVGTKHAEAIPDYVLDYQPPEEKEAEELPNMLFADSHRRLFPINSPAATWLSAAYFSKHASLGDLPYTADEAEHIKGLLLKAANLYNIEQDAVKISHDIVQQDAAESSDPADDNSNYGWVMKSASGDTVAKKYPMFDTLGVEKAAEYFDTYRARYPRNVRMHIAKNILKKASEYGVEEDSLPGSIMREAGFGLPQGAVVMDELLRRAKLTKDAEDSLALANINLMISDMGNAEFSANIDKIAEVLDAFDRNAELVQYYGTKLLMPADFLYEVSLKQAEAGVEGAVALDKYVFSAEKLAELTPDVFSAVLGDGAVRDMSTDNKLDREKVAAVLSSLPMPDKAALEAHLTAVFSRR